MSSLCGTQVSTHWALHHCLKYMQMRRIIVRSGTHNLEIPQARANKREPESHVLTSKRGKAFLSPKDNSNKTACYRCGCYNHVTKKCRTPKHLVELYMKSMGRTQNTQKHEAHFVSQVPETEAMEYPSRSGTKQHQDSAK